MAGVNYLISERVVVPSTKGCCKAGGSEHHADDQGELHLCDSSEVELFGMVVCLCLERSRGTQQVNCILYNSSCSSVAISLHIERIKQQGTAYGVEQDQTSC